MLWTRDGELDGTSDGKCSGHDVAVSLRADVACLSISRRRPPLRASASMSAGDKPGSMLQQGPGLLFLASAPRRRRYESARGEESEKMEKPDMKKNALWHCADAGVRASAHCP
jgi:hypothetical protein